MFGYIRTALSHFTDKICSSLPSLSFNVVNVEGRVSVTIGCI